MGKKNKEKNIFDFHLSTQKLRGNYPSEFYARVLLKGKGVAKKKPSKIERLLGEIRFFFLCNRDERHREQKHRNKTHENTFVIRTKENQSESN